MMNIRTTITAIVAGMLLSGCKCESPEQGKPFSAWTPSVDQPIRQLEEVLASLEQQQPMNYTSANLAFLYDAKLYLLFQDYLAVLPESERASQIAEQKQWLAKRKELVQDAYAKYEGGTLAPFSASQASINLTKKRIDEIEAKMRETSDQ
jgi:uncharacterized protein YecT (DUF1311 family)